MATESLRVGKEPSAQRGTPATGRILDADAVMQAWRERWDALPGRSPLEPETAQSVVAFLLEDGEWSLADRPEFADLGDVTFDRLACLRDVLRDLLHAVTDPPVDASLLMQHLDQSIHRLLTGAQEAERTLLEFQALTDPLTGVWNRRALERDLQRELARAQRSGREVTVIVLDLDGLKHINDSLGHAAGDAAILELAAAFTRELRAVDSIYRIGGDEFVVMLPETTADSVDALFARVAASAPAFSAGVATGPADAGTVRALVDLADQRLVRSRRDARYGPDFGLVDRPPVADERVSRPAVDQRVVIRALSAVGNGTRFAAEVTLAQGDLVVTETADGPAVPQATGRIVLEATLRALGSLGLPVDGWFIDAATITRLGTESVALVSVVLPRRDGPLALTGTAPVRRDEVDAYARAALDALMRMLSAGNEPPRPLLSAQAPAS